MTDNFPNLFSPVAVGSYTLRNRIMNTGHAAHHQSGDGTPTEAYVHYLRERAKGGAGLIVTAHTVPVYDGETSLSLTNFHDDIVPIYQRIAEAVHEFDVPTLAQLGHRGRRVADDSAFIGRPVVAPSAVPPPDFSVPVYMPHELTTGEAEALVGNFADAARRMRRSDFDGVELAVGMDYLFANFLHPHGNRRTDKYGGGTTAERMTFLRETLAAIRSELGAERILGIRLYDDVMDYSLKLSDLVELARLLDRENLVDYFNIWHGIVPSPKQGRMHWPSYYYEPGAFTYLPEAVKSVVSRPVVGTGRMDSPAVAERVLADGKADIVGMAKTLIADPHFPNKARAGRVDDIRPCIACTQACVGHVDIGLGVGCIYNPVTGREQDWAELRTAERKKKIVIVGAGPAGMEAARIAGQRGHDVVLMDRNRRLGGQIDLVMKAPDRGSFEEIILWFERQLPKHGVEIRLGIEATLETVLAADPDEIVLATGSTAYFPEIEGVERSHVFSARDVLAGRAALGESVLVVDTLGRAEAATTADYLAMRGHKVELLTGLETVAPFMPSPTRHHLLERLMKAGVALTTHTALWEIGEAGAEAYNTVTWEPRTIGGFDSVVFGSGGKADTRLYEELSAHRGSLHPIGDCFQPRDIEVAVVDGHRVARGL